MTGLGAIGVVATLFTGLYPRVMVSHPTFANSLTISNAAAGHYALQVITVVAAIFTPLVLIYQSWTYHVFRKRLRGEEVVYAIHRQERTFLPSRERCPLCPRRAGEENGIFRLGRGACPRSYACAGSAPWSKPMLF